MKRTTLKLRGLVSVESSGGPLHVEYALFDPEERELGRSDGRVVELGFRTTVREARARLAQLGASPERAASVVAPMVPALVEAFARGGPARRVVSLLEPAVLLDSSRYDAAAASYPGTFLDLAAIEAELGGPGVTWVFQALALAAQLARLDDGARVELDTLAYASSLKPGANTYSRVTLDALGPLPGLLADLAARGGGRGARGAVVGQTKLVELLRGRLHGGPQLDACLRAIEAAREAPSSGALASSGLWEIELLLDAGNFAAASQELVALERSDGRTPTTAYLRARHELLTRVESPDALARRLVRATQGAGAFPELVVLASEAALAAGQESVACELALRALDEPSLPALHRERATMLVQRCGAAPRPPPVAVVGRLDSRAEPSPRRAVDPRAEGDAESPYASLPRRGHRSSTVPPARTSDPHRVRGATRSSPPPRSPTIPPAPPVARLGSSFALRRTSVQLPVSPSVPELELMPRGSSPPEPPEQEVNVVDHWGPRAAGSSPPPIAVGPWHEHPVELATAPSTRPPALAPSRPPSALPHHSESGHPTAEPAGYGPQMADPSGASLAFSVRDVAPEWFGCAPALPRADPRASEAAEELPLPLPPGLLGATLREELPQSVLEARLQFTFLSRELGRLYRGARLTILRADMSGIEQMQTHLVERFASGEVTDAAGAAELRMHGAFLSEILARRLGGEWIDIRSEHLAHWEMMIAPGTRVWPFARVARYVAKAHRERDLVAYFLELQTLALLAERR